MIFDITEDKKHINDFRLQYMCRNLNIHKHHGVLDRYKYTSHCAKLKFYYSKEFI